MAASVWLDDFTRDLSRESSRRGALRALFGGMLGTLGRAPVEPAAAKSCDPQCYPFCQECRKLPCKKSRKFKHHKGRCRPKYLCVPLANDSPCIADGRCLDGICNPKPDCASAASACRSTEPHLCCSGTCFPAIPGEGVCLAGQPHAPCLADSDCLSEQCIGYRCLCENPINFQCP